MREFYKSKKPLSSLCNVSPCPLLLLPGITPLSIIFKNTIATLRYSNYQHPYLKYYKSYSSKVFSYDELECISDNIPNKRNLKWYANRTNYAYTPRMSLKERSKK